MLRPEVLMPRADMVSSRRCIPVPLASGADVVLTAGAVAVVTVAAGDGFVTVAGVAAIF